MCKFLCALIAFLIVLQWKCENLLGEKEPNFTETSTPQIFFCAIQKNLCVNTFYRKVIEGEGSVLEQVMKEKTAAKMGFSKKEGGVITLGQENTLWEKYSVLNLHQM